MVGQIVSELVGEASRSRFNNPFTRMSDNGMGYIPTRMTVPSWTSQSTLERGVSNFSSGELTLNRVSDARPLSTLRESPLFPDFRKHFKSEELIEEVREAVPSTNPEIHEWMQTATAEAAVLNGWASEYGQNSEVRVNTGDPANPGLRVQDISFPSIRGRDIGNSVTATTPVGNYEVAAEGSKTMIGRDFIGWGACSGASGYQWNGKLAQYVEIASTPIDNTVRFPNVGGGVLPNFINQAPESSTERARVSFDITSNRRESIDVTFRSPLEYTSVMDESTITVDEGVTNVSFAIASAPEVPPILTQLQPTRGGSDVQSVGNYTVEAI